VRVRALATSTGVASALARTAMDGRAGPGAPWMVRATGAVVVAVVAFAFPPTASVPPNGMSDLAYFT
jgi:hypothetical protein